jgi:CheY-like chemotaxis protein
MEAIGRLAGGVAHDFNNILSVILSYGELILDGLRPSDPLRGDVEEITKAASRAAGLTRQLLMFSRQQVVAPKVLSLHEVLTPMMQMMQRLLGADVELVVVAPNAAGRVKVDPSHIEQVVLNLVVNARDAMPTGGKLTIETANVELDDEYASSHLPSRAGPHVMLSVSDNGSGMSQETQARIFEPFFSTKGPGKGTGLGLATVYGIVKQSGGHIGVYSEPGHGSTFRVYLPLVQGDAESAAPEQRETPAGGSETVLVVEDDESIRRLALRVLEPAGYTVICAPSGRDALLLAGERPPQLLVTDVVLPDIDGGALAASFHDRYPGVRVLFMSGYLDEAIVRHGAPSTGQDFIPKPFTAAEFLRRVREALDRGQLDAANRGQPGA